MRHRVGALFALLIVLLIAGCGAGRAPARHALPSHAKAAAPADHCTPGNEAMGCLLPPAPLALAQTTGSVASGIDFAWSCPSPAGHGLGASYLSPDGTKNWTRACVNAYHAAHAATVAVWESAGTRALDGCAAGAADAHQAAAQLAALGAPADQPFDMAIDFDASGPDVAAYFQCASQAEPGRVNAYGGYRPLAYLAAHGLVGHLNWQTYAWSGGAWLPASIAPLEQYLNGSAVDYDRALAANYGQWPAPAAPGPAPALVRHYQRVRNTNLAAYRRHRCTGSVLGAPSVCRTAGSNVLAAVQWLDAQHAQPAPTCWGPHALLGAAACQIARPRLSVWSHARAASWNAYMRLGCQGPAEPIASSRRDCRRLQQRANYFDRHASALFKAWS